MRNTRVRWACVVVAGIAVALAVYAGSKLKGRTAERELRQWLGTSVAGHMQCSHWSARFDVPKDSSGKRYYYSGAWPTFLRRLNLAARATSVGVTTEADPRPATLADDSKLPLKFEPKEGGIAVTAIHSEGEAAWDPSESQMLSPPLRFYALQSGTWRYVRTMANPLANEPRYMLFGGKWERDEFYERRINNYYGAQQCYKKVSQALGALRGSASLDSERGYSVLKDRDMVWILEAPGRSWAIATDQLGRVLMLARSDGTDRKCFYPGRGPRWSASTSFDDLTNVTDGLQLSANGKQVLRVLTSDGREATIGNYLADTALSKSRWFTLLPTSDLAKDWPRMSSLWRRHEQPMR